MESQLLGAATQFGIAGLMAWMWLTERRSATERERQINDAHQRLIEDRIHFGAVIELVRENTRAVTALEAGQRALLDLARSIAPAPAPPPPPPRPPTVARNAGPGDSPYTAAP